MIELRNAIRELKPEDIVVTGSISSGKSFVSNKLAKILNAKVLNCDKEIAYLYHNVEVKDKLQTIFGTSSKEDIVKAYDCVDYLKKLEKLFYPFLAKKIRENCRQNFRRKIILEIPLFYELKVNTRAKVICVTTSYRMRSLFFGKRNIDIKSIRTSVILKRQFINRKKCMIAASRNHKIYYNV